MIPYWFTMVSIVMLAFGGICSVIITVDIVMGHRQQMGIMNLVWPLNALFGTFVTLWAYFKYGRLATRQKVMEAKNKGEETPSQRQTPFWAMVGKGTAHCGAGCLLGDICAEFLAFSFPVILTWMGWKTLFPDTHAGKVYAGWVLDYLFAFVIGVAFQYFTIVPMRHLPPGQGILQAAKADALSLTAWQVGMYGMMAVAQFFLFTAVWPAEIKPTMPEFWVVMQIAMLAGFATSYPINWWLIQSGIKEKM